MIDGLLGSCCTSCCPMRPNPPFPATRSGSSCDVVISSVLDVLADATGRTAQASEGLRRAQRSGTYLARGAKQRPPDLAFPQVRGPLALVAGEGFEPSKLSRWIYSPLPLAARATCLVRMEG